MVTVAKRSTAVGREESAAARSIRWPVRLVVGATAAFVVFFSWLVLAKHAHFGTRAFDLAIFDQGLWLLSEGHTPFVTVRGLHLFADHTSFLLIPLVPLYWIWSDVRLLLVVTVMALAAGGPLVYAVSRAEGLERRPAAGLAVAYLLLPAVHWQIWDVFHPEVLAIPLLLAAYLAAARSRPGWALSFLALVLLAKEDAALIVIPLAIYLGLRFREWKVAAWGTLMGVGALILAFGIVLPHFSPTGELIYTGRYQEFGGSMLEIIWGIATSPGAVLASALDGRGLVYLAVLTLPLAVSLFAPEVLLVAVPTLLANLLSAHHYQAEIMYHYTAYVIPIVALGAVLGTKRLLGRRRSWPLRRWRGAIVLAVAALLVGSIAAGPWGLGRRNPWRGDVADAQSAANALVVIPADAAVAADSRIVPHLAHRRSVYVFPNPVVASNWAVPGQPGPPSDDFDWLVVRADLSGMDEVFMEELVKLTAEGVFAVVTADDALVVLHRVTAVAAD